MKSFIAVILYIILISIIVMQYIHKEKENIKHQEIIEIYNNMKKYTGISGYIPPFKIIQSNVINAWINPKEIVMTTGMIDFLNDRDMIASVIGHEIGHFVLTHFQLDKVDSRLKEANADSYSSYLMMRAGYNVCKMKYTWILLIEKYGNSILTTSHPSHMDRAYNLDFPQCN